SLSFSIHSRLSASFEEQREDEAYCAAFRADWKLLWQGSAFIWKPITTFNQVEVQMAADGTLTCSKPFESRVNLWEEDNSKHDYVDQADKMFWFDADANGDQAGRQSQRFRLHGVGDEDFWFLWAVDNHVEPVVTIEHTCGTAYACLCIKLGSRDEDFHDQLGIIDLEKTKLDTCNVCEYALEVFKKGGR
ncbi:hypothetical protein PMAYCL1PPCAC_22664, partial [Pristionchus mayeri]